MARILLVEDDELISRMINMRLTLRGHQVEPAQNGQEALDRLALDHFDLVLMDMHMPVMDGHKATQALRKRDYTG